ncbi:MAG: glycosyltransferase [Lachnospiraceae bacterium]|nr:glycosyltransferase [Lachnospiraceae bacterium]
MKKKLLLIVPNLRFGGQQRVIANVAQIMTSDYDVTVVLFDGRDPAFHVDCRVVDFSIPAAPGRLRKIKNVLLRAYKLRKLKRKEQFDFCLSTGPTANLINVLSKGHGMTIVRTSSYDDCKKNTINRYIFRHCDCAISCAELTRKKLISTFDLSPEKVFTIYNPLDIHTILERGNENVSDYVFSAHTVVSLGRLDAGKNFPRIIKAFSLAKKEIRDAQLLVIGDGEEKKKLEEVIGQFKLQDSVTLLGFRINSAPYLKRSCVFVQASFVEGFPNALVEGMCFLPVIAADCKSGPREILSNGRLDVVCNGIEEADYGILVRPANMDELKRDISEEITENDRLLAEAILVLLQDEDKREKMKKRAAERVKSFTFNRFRDSLVDILEQ